MNNQIIEAMDYLGKKIGLVVDWSSENIYPQLIEFMGRYKVYSIVEDVIYALICVCVIFAFVWFIKKCLIPDYNLARDKHTDTKFYDRYECLTPNIQLNATGITIIVFGGIFFVIAIIFTILEARDIIRWIFIPEYQFYNIVSGLIK